MSYTDQLREMREEEARQAAERAAAVDTDDSEPVDRELPSVNARKKTNKGLNLLAIIFIGLIGAYLIYTMNAGGDKKQKALEAKEEKEAKQNAISGSLPKLNIPDKPPEPAFAQTSTDTGNSAPQTAPTASNGSAGALAPPKPAAPVTTARAATGANGKPEKTPEELMRDRRRLGTITMKFEAAEASGQSGGGRPYAQPANYDNGGTAGGGEVNSSLKPGSGGNDDLSKQLQPTITKGTVAAKLFDRNYLIPKGAFIDCALETRIDSTTSGMTSCILSKNVYSDNGNLVLLDRGSKIVGQYQGGMMKQGSNRIFVLWTRVETPTGIVINLDSPGTDALGASGLDGYIDTHFWERFGGAIMLSLIQDGFAAAANRQNGGGGQTNVNLGNTQNATQNMASDALKNTINIPPTLKKNQGEHINIFVARDLDFRSVYGFRSEQ